MMPASLAYQIRLEISYRNRIAPFWYLKRFYHCLCVYVWLFEFTCIICMWILSETRGHWVLRNWCLLWLLVINLDPLQEHQALLTIKTSLELYPFWTIVISSRELNGFRCCLFYPQKKSVCLQSFKWSPNTEIWGKPWRSFSRLLLYLENTQHENKIMPALGKKHYCHQSAIIFEDFYIPKFQTLNGPGRHAKLMEGDFPIVLSDGEAYQEKVLTENNAETGKFYNMASIVLWDKVQWVKVT